MPDGSLPKYRVTSLSFVFPNLVTSYQIKLSQSKQRNRFLTLVRFLGGQSMSVGLFHVPRTHGFVPAIEGTRLGRFLPRAALSTPAPGRGGGLSWWPRQRSSSGFSIFVTLLLSPLAQIWWDKPVSSLHCTEELFLSALSRPLSSLLQGRGQVIFTPVK